MSGFFDDIFGFVKGATYFGIFYLCYMQIYLYIGELEYFCKFVYKVKEDELPLIYKRKPSEHLDQKIEHISKELKRKISFS